ncbi:Diacylglycerol kinase [Pelomyxa schiedti]|nr:Diacylglycerol kinase [Pelomyxa schiedti]
MVVILRDRFRVGGDLTLVTLTEEQLTWTHAETLHTVRVCDVVYAVEGNGVLNVHSCPLCSISQGRTHVVHTFDWISAHHNSLGEIFTRCLFTPPYIYEASLTLSKWVKSLQDLCSGHYSHKQSLLFILNPISGKGYASHVFHTQCAPLLHFWGVSHQLMGFEPTHLEPTNKDDKETRYESHATEIGKSFQTGAYSGIITVSGDGLLGQLVNGMLGRQDWHEAIQTPIGVIPAGTMNGLSSSLLVTSPTVSMFNILRGVIRPFDAMLFVQPKSKRVHWGIVNLLWGLFAEIDFNSEKFRCMGPLREYFCGLFKLIDMPSFPMKFNPNTVIRSTNRIIQAFISPS